MKEKHIYICNDSTVGIFTGIYKAWESKYGHDNNQILVKEPDNMVLFSKFIYVEPDVDLAEKVKRSIYQKISREAYICVYNASVSEEFDKADVIYRFLIIGFAMGKPVLEHLSQPAVLRLSQLDRNVRRELRNYKGFLRFVDLEHKVLVAQFRPKNDLLYSLADHFADRMNSENWIIYDKERKKAAIHESGKRWIIVEGWESDFFENIDQIQAHDEFLSMWCEFVSSIAIKERENPKLQLNMMPNRYREFTPELEYRTK